MSAPPVITFAGVAPKAGASTSALVGAIAAPWYSPAAMSTVIDIHGDVCAILGVSPVHRHPRPPGLDAESSLADVVREVRRVRVGGGAGVVEVLPTGSLEGGDCVDGNAVAHIALLLARSGRAVTIDAGCFEVVPVGALVQRTALVVLSDASRAGLDRARVLAGRHGAACTIALDRPGRGGMERPDLAARTAPVVPIARTDARQRWYESGCRAPAGALNGLLVDAAEVHSLAERHLERRLAERKAPRRSERDLSL